MLELLRGLPIGREALQTLRTSPLYLFYNIWKWKHLEANNLNSDLIFTMERVRGFIDGVMQCPSRSRCREGHVADRPGNSMQPTCVSQQTPPQALDSVPAKFPREPPYLRVSRPWVWAGQQPFESIRTLAWPTASPPIVEPMT
jgi:hypothetical protein